MVHLFCLWSTLVSVFSRSLPDVHPGLAAYALSAPHAVPCHCSERVHPASQSIVLPSALTFILSPQTQPGPYLDQDVGQL